MNSFLVDESLSPLLSEKIRNLGYDVKAVRETSLKGSDDLGIVEWAIRNKLIIITGDLDFGELWYWYYYGKLGIIILRMKSYKLESQYKIIKFLHDNGVLKKEIKSSLIISTSTRYRIRS